ncbi:terminal EAR1-like 1 [Forsythia ovata]|uniref:Terminal EAR1-like 1 n=1 Tax=Forsythia ovata TaxID=205694 RepID=A0ABD1WBX8_9LAMI
MDDTSFHRFPGHLDPRAQEFFPTTTLPLLPLQIYYPQPTPPPYLPQEALPPHMGYPQQHFANPPPPVYLSPVEPQPLPVSLPPSSSSPTRTLLLSMVPTDVSESTVRRELEVFGDVRAVQMERLREGVVTVHFYDVRDAQQALLAIQEQHMQQQCRLGRHYDALLQAQNNSIPLMPIPLPPLPPPARGLISGRVVWAQFTSPVTSVLPDGNNQGTIVIFNLDPQVSTVNLKEIFEAFGPVKELRETPNKKNQRFVEFYDVRNAAKAVAGMNGKEIYGKQIVIEFSRPGGRLPRLSQINKFNSTTNYWSRNSQIPPPSPSPPPHLQHKLSGRLLANAPRRSYNSRTELSRKASYFKGNPSAISGGSKSSSSGGSLRGSVASLYISGGGSGGGNRYEESCNIRPPNKKNSKKNKNETSSGSKSGGPWKSSGGSGKHGRDYDPRFLINEDAIMESNCRDSRTTVMIKNIPNKYSQKLLLNMLDNHCIHCNEQIADGDDQPMSAYDFVYLPIDFINKCNVGYGFVNMTSPEATLRLYKAFHNQSWEVFNSRKICEVTYARLQGIEALREHFKNSKFPGDAEEYMPVVFTPPRDGQRLTEPMPIVNGGGGRSIGSGSPTPLLLSSSSPAASSEEQEESESSYDHNIEYSEDLLEVDGSVSHDYEVARDRSNPSNGGDSGGCSC